MGDKGKRDKGKREEQKKGKQFGQIECKRKTRSQLIRELVKLHQQVGELEALKYDICY